jgi:hypothetical protein
MAAGSLKEAQFVLGMTGLFVSRSGAKSSPSGNWSRL